MDLNELSNEFLLRIIYRNLDADTSGEHVDSETKLDMDNDRRRHGINNQEKI